jgi:RNA polymerase sigma factor (sigma-70 family)
MEVSALKPAALPALRGPSALLRLQSDERLIALTRRGEHAAFETLFSRYHARLLAFCRHMLSSREDAEDVLQEVFTAAFNAILADEREINVRPWLYRIARNRSLNHLRRASAIGVDSMDVHFAEGGISTGEKVLRRESFRQLIADVQQLPETQRTALLLREIDALSYDQIAEAMETTIPSVKSLLVRARISLAEAAEARQLTCEQVREQLGEVAEGLHKLDAPARRHMRSCERCRGFRKQLKSNNVALAAVMPVGVMLVLKKLLTSKLGASAGHVAGGSAAGAAAGGGGAASGLATAGVGTIATKAVAGLAAAALVTAGAVEAGHSTPRRRPPSASAAASSPAAIAAAPPPVVLRTVPQPASSQRSAVAANAHRRAHRHGAGAKPPHDATAKVAAQTATTSSSTATESTTSLATTETSDPTEGAPATEVVTESSQLPSSSTSTTSTTTSTTEASASASSAAGQPPAAPATTPTPTPEEPALAAESGGTPAPPASPEGG